MILELFLKYSQHVSKQLYGDYNEEFEDHAEYIYNVVKMSQCCQNEPMFLRCAHRAYGGNILGTFWTTILNVMSDNMLGKWQSNISNVPRMNLVGKG